MLDFKSRKSWIHLLLGFVVGFVAGGSVATFNAAEPEPTVVEEPENREEN